MSDYTRTNNFTVKDGLATGNAAKIIKGSDVDAELNAALIAINTKFDSDDLDVASGIPQLDSSGKYSSTLLPATWTAQFVFANAIGIDGLQVDLTARNLIELDAADEVNVGDVNNVLNLFGSSVEVGGLAVLTTGTGAAQTITLTAGTLLTGGGDLSANRTFNVDEASINHDALTNFVADEHILHAGVTLTAGNGLSGGGTISASRSFALDLNELGVETSAAVGDFIAMVDITDSGSQKITLANLGTSISGSVDHDATANFASDEHVAHAGVSIVTGATSGLSGGGTIAATRTLLTDFNRLTSATPVDADSFAFYDAGAGANRKVLGSALKTYIGSGLTTYTASATASATLSIDEAHSLGAQPTMVQAYIECTTANLGYSIGDRVYVGSWQTSADTTDGMSFGADTTNVYAKVSVQLLINHKSTRTMTVITYASWNFEVAAIL